MARVKSCIPRKPQCTLGRLMPIRIDSEAIKRQGWRDQKILVVSLDDPRLDLVDREFVRQIGAHLYGQV